MTGGDDAGSVLVDALVAIGIMAVVLILSAQVAADGARRSRAAETSRLAGLEARSRLAEVGGDIPLQPGSDAGQDGDFEWRVQVAPAAGLTSKAGRLFDVTASVSQRGGAVLVTLHTQRFGAA